LELTEALESAFDTAQPEATQTAPIEAPAESAAETRARDEAGRFARNEPVAPAPAEPVQAPAPAVAEAPKTTFPSSWKKEVAPIWQKVDQGEPLTVDEIKLIQQEALRREGDFHKGIDGFKSNADKGRAYEQALAPFQETLKALNVDGVTAVTELMKADHILRHAPESVKVQKILELANVYGIDLQKQFSPDVARYEQELFQTREQLKQIESQRENESKHALNSDIETFASTPGHEHFEAVRAHMAALLQGGQAKDLSDAYEQAVYANPTTRAAMLQQQAAQVSAGAQAQRAKAAAVSIRGSSPASGASSAVETKSIKDAVSAAFDQHSS
jgi:hypothetical protein